MKQNNNLEDQLKDAFGNFEPEVNPSLWTKISSQLPAGPSPAQPVTEPSGLLSSLGSAGTWLAGSAAVIISGAAIYFTLNTSTGPETLIVPEPKSTITGEQQLPATQPLPVTDQSKIVNPVEVNPDQSIAAASTETVDVNSTEEVKSTEEANNQRNTSEPSASSHSQDVNPITAPKPEIPAAEKARIEQSLPSADTNIPLKIITSISGGFAPLSITAMSNQTGGNAEFDFGDGVVSRNESATHIYRKAGIYTIRCTAAGHTSEQEIEVLDPLPTAFSPNGDGANDVFEIRNPEISETEIHIYNRSGRKVFSGKGDTVSWNGQYEDGRPAETGTYFYDIFATSSRGNAYKQKGTLTLFR